MIPAVHRRSTGRRPRCCRTCLKPMQGHPTGKNNPCRAATAGIHQPSPIKPWPRANQTIGRMMDSFCSRETGEDVDADNELEEFDTSYEYPSASSSSSDECATSTSTLVNAKKRRLVPCTPPPPSKRAGTCLPRSRRSLSPDIAIELIPPVPHSGDRSFFLESPFHHAPYPVYPPDPISPTPPFAIPDIGGWSRVNPNHKHPANNVQLVGLSMQRSDSAGSARPTEFVPSPARVPAARRARRSALSAVPDAPGLQMLQPPPSHPEKFWGSECPTERAGSESRVPTPAPAYSIPAAPSSARPSGSALGMFRMQYLEVPTRAHSRSRTASVAPEEEEHPFHHSRYTEDEDEDRVPAAPGPLVSGPRLPDIPQDHAHPLFKIQSESGIMLASSDIAKTLLHEFLGSLKTWTGFTAALGFWMIVFFLMFAAALAADWVKENWLS